MSILSSFNSTGRLDGIVAPTSWRVTERYAFCRGWVARWSDFGTIWIQVCVGILIRVMYREGNQISDSNFSRMRFWRGTSVEQMKGDGVIILKKGLSLSLTLSLLSLSLSFSLSLSLSLLHSLSLSPLSLKYTQISTAHNRAPWPQMGHRRPQWGPPTLSLSSLFLFHWGSELLWKWERTICHTNGHTSPCDVWGRESEEEGERRRFVSSCNLFLYLSSSLSLSHAHTHTKAS